ncbi:hypothetical protein [Thermomonospora umbrina]|uniref:Uncharacterized protein n=1 Tax=Thermomonospora umbrina TaxID=111806 RepID=A0A3D9SWD9_9ACTN|nr:hypothetical protein [Thermomonospora umbrina]REF00263.1 hypothetical protein DFJ69_5792 [Thermomonospora umbrina]
MTRLRGTHRRNGSTTTGEQPTAPEPEEEAPVTTEVRTDESLDQTWQLRTDALQAADEFGAQAMVAEAQQQSHADALQRRERAAVLLQEANEFDAAETEAAGRAAALRAAESRQRAVAADHADTVDAKVRQSGRQHPAERRERQVTVPDGMVGSHGPQTQGMPQVPTDDGQAVIGNGAYPSAPGGAA